MDKRAAGSFFVCMLLAVALVCRVAVINDTISSGVAVSQSSRRIQIADSEGMIYDRNMKPLVNRQCRTILAVNPDNEALECLKTQLTTEEYKTAAEKAASGKPFILECENYNGDSSSIIAMTVYERYSSDDVAVHTIGYTDSQGNGVYGIEKAFDSLLSSFSGTLSVRYSADATGRMLKGQEFEAVNDNYASSGGIVLTVDREIQNVCEDSAERNNMESGGIVVLDADTSEILALVSLPSFDRENLSAAMKDSRSPFVNRVLNAYSVGSVFKPVVVAAALEEGIDENTVFECKGYVTINGMHFNCHKKDGHGMLDMAHAVAVSCNSYFIQLSQQVGAEKIISMASALGFGTEISLCDSMTSKLGILPAFEDIDSSAALANLSFGQGKLLATPLQIAAVYCAFANGGYYREPYILKEMVDADSVVTAYYKNEINNKILPDSICSKIGKMLSLTVSEGSGRLAKPMCYEAAGKTATAETGWIENGNEVYHTWFAGYYPDKNPEYVIVVFNEYGESSSTDCAPVFRDIADGITALETG